MTGYGIWWDDAGQQEGNGAGKKGGGRMHGECAPGGAKGTEGKDKDGIKWREWKE